MEICDIQLENSTNKVEITFCSLHTMEDVMTLKMSPNDAWKIADFCRDKLSYANKKNKET